MLQAAWKKNDKKARVLIFLFSGIVFSAIVLLSRVTIKADLGFDPHVFAKANAIINSIVAVLLIAALVAVKNKKFIVHKNIMLTAMVLSILFLVSYICHHLFAGETKFGGEGINKTLYYIVLFTHIPLAGIILPFILFSAYRALTGEFDKHKKLVRITWPVWFYVAVTGVVVYWMISPYYG
jgi:putative membrane protein